ncbi:hypothetical protein [Tateyamaria sp. SN3-11]|uniref:hypothetical protein n=1 Tax=Tateyamaria sp. SN3-11 TaxID=3092147 RepID=UPI0039E89193
MRETDHAREALDRKYSELSRLSLSRIEAANLKLLADRFDAVDRALLRLREKHLSAPK